MNRKIKIFSFCISLGLISLQSLFAQESILKAYAQGHSSRKLAFYPSTLRMLNLQKNEEYNAVVNDIEKLLVYVMDSASTATQYYQQIPEAYLLADFDEYISVSGGKLTLTLLGKEQSGTNNLTGYFVQNDRAIAFYLTGSIPFEKVYQLIQSIREEDFINPLNLTNNSF